MTDRKRLSEQVQVDPSGRVTLSDGDLDIMLSSTEVTAGSGTINEVCNNSGDCDGSMNTSSCTNSSTCVGSLNAAGQCKSPKDVPGG